MQSTKQRQTMTIGRLAEAAELNVETIRYYQRIGLITEPKKPPQGYRVYPQETLEQLLFIKRAKQLGFGLQEIAELLELGGGECSDVRKRAEKKRDKIAQQIKDLQVLQTTLEQLISACQAEPGNQSCPIVETLLDSTN